ncbi:hypothetical protein HYH03_007659 [Edaphochlamys debaryana]|uniref:Uncharacterized protein n=1 Tax=Edaphochlamys debaryana TaxID=47281 RepID=A0A836BYY1_9CHLO|nr:hypothetical protein HYH03_007659 [Edaphochlamys debaryana]|eukprot:KAG2494306.1 hypothetical protein HYH03_007659 [Edaphochlamys debaryana]
MCIPLIFLAVVLGFHWASSAKKVQSDGPLIVPCAPHNEVPKITDIYMIHSYWSEERKSIAPGLCQWFKENGGDVLSHAPCTLFPGFWAHAAPRAQILDLMARRVVAPETHARPLGALSKLLYWFGFSGAAPLFDEEENVVNLSLLGIAASHLLAVQNWTLEMTRVGIPPSERVKRHLLLFEDDAVVTKESVAALGRSLQYLDPCYDMVGLDSTDNFCALNRLTDALLGILMPRSWLRSPRLVPARMTFSRNTALLFSYKGAVRMLKNMPVTREVDLWYRDLASDGVLDVYVTCPRVIGIQGLTTVK